MQIDAFMNVKIRIHYLLVSYRFFFFPPKLKEQKAKTKTNKKENEREKAINEGCLNCIGPMSQKLNNHLFIRKVTKDGA